MNPTKKKCKQKIAFRRILTAVFLGWTCCAAADSVIYRNDFTMRTSAEPIPATNVWHEAAPYPAKMEELTVRPTTATGTASYEELSTRAAYYSKSVYSSRPSIDGWFMPFFNYRESYTLYIAYTNSERAVTTDGAYKLTPYVIQDDGNGCFTWAYGSDTRRAGVVLDSLHNTFTNGQVRIQVDMRAPDRWPVKGGCSYVRVFPVFDKYMDILAWNGSWCDKDQTTLATCSFTNSPATPGKFGIRSTGSQIKSSSDETYFTRSYPQLYDLGNYNGNTLSSQIGNNYGTEFNYWFRFITTYNFETAKFDITLYRIKNDVGHPTFDTEMSGGNILATSTRPGRIWQNCATNVNSAGAVVTDIPALLREKGGISGIGIDGIGSYNLASGAITNKVLVDNIRVSWKAPGAEDFEVCYENDFSTRRYRTLSAANRGTESTAYAPRTVVTNASTTFTGYTKVASNFEVERIVPPITSPADKAQPIGLDGWRLLPYADVNDANSCHPGVSDYTTGGDPGGEGGFALTYGNQGAWSLMGQTLETAYTSGKVRILADVRLPLGGLNTWKTGTRRIAIGLGSAAMYSADRNSLAANLAAGIGYVRTVSTKDGSTVTNDVPYCLAASVSDSTPGYTVADDPVIPEKATWYRYDLTADLDSRTYSGTITPIGTISVTPDFTLTNDAIYSVEGVPFAADVSDIGSFYLRAFGYGNTYAVSTYYINRRVVVDNIRVYRVEPAAEEGGEETSRLVYENTFDKRVRSTGADRAIAAGHLAEQYDRDDGPDHWIRRNGTGDAAFLATATVRDDGGNQYLALGREDYGGNRVQVSHTFGQYVRRPFRFRVDVRPPEAWTMKSGFAMFGIGRAGMEQTEIGVSAFDAYRQIAFGFSNVVSTASIYSPYHNVQTVAFAVGGEGLQTIGAVADYDPAHWYRFNVSVNPETETFDVKVYDMGAAHPVADSPSIGLVASVSGVPFANPAYGEGIGAFYIHSYGAGGARGEAGVDPGNVMVDNIEVMIRSGTVFMVR